MKKLCLLLLLNLCFIQRNHAQWAQIINDTAAFNSGAGNDIIRYGGYLWFAQGNNIRKFDGTNWHNGKGINYPFGSDYPFVFTIYRDTLYGGGRFVEVSTGKTFGVIKWTGTKWVPEIMMSNAGFVFSMVSYNDFLYIGGDFYTIGNLSDVFNRKSLVRYNGDSCNNYFRLSSLCGAGSAIRVFALDSIGGKLYVGGEFDSVNSMLSSKVFIYKNTVIQKTINFGVCTGDVVKDFGVYNDTILAVGAHYTGPSTSSVYKLVNDSIWIQFGSNISPTPQAIAIADDSIFVGSSNYGPVSVWNNQTYVWQNRSGGISSLTGTSPQELYFDNITGKLYIAGTFMRSFGDVANGIAVYEPIKILPIELISFDCSLQDQVVKLVWQTVSELNNSHFEIERSFDGIHFQIIGTVPGAPNSNSLKTYEYHDNGLFIETSLYYRLRQVDFDGQSKTSDICVVKIPDSDQLFILNPFVNDILRLNISIESAFIVNSIGMKVKSFSGNELSVQDLPAGAYILVVNNRPYRFIKK